MQDYKWAVVGTGYIAESFSQCMELVPGAHKTAVVGSSAEKAEAFAQAHGFARSYGYVHEMLRDAEPDIVYIATPNDTHYDFVMAALRAKKHVLCEKPMPDNVKQLREMTALARKNGVFLMEGLWTRCFPAIRKASEWLRGGAIGQVRSVHAGFGLKALEQGWQPWKRDVARSAGAIRDVGIYVLGIAALAFGRQPAQIHSSVVLEGGTDMHAELLLDYGEGRSASLTSSFLMTSDHRAMIYGDTGAIRLGKKLWCPDWAELFRYSDSDVFTLEPVDDFDGAYESNGLQFEISHVMDCIDRGQTESEWYTLAETRDMHALIDDLRKEWGVHYPSD